MTYVPLVLGILLALAGCLSIISGYDIITIERGWTEVIAGTTAVSGGVISICLWFVLRQIYHLRQAVTKAQVATKSSFEAAATVPAAAPASRIVSDAENKPAVLTPLATAFIADEASSPKTFTDAVDHNAEPEIDDAQKTFDFTSESPQEVSAEAEPRLAAEPKRYEVTEPTLLQLSPLAERVADVRIAEAHPAEEYPSEEHVEVPRDAIEEALFAATMHPAEPEPIEEPVAQIKFEEAQLGEAEVEPAHDSAADALPVEEAKEDELAPSPSALSLDEMWRRVSEEIERPILPAKTPPAKAPFAKTPLAERNWLEPRRPAQPAPEPPPAYEASPASEPEPVAAAPLVEDDILARDDALERALEEELRARAQERAHEAYAPKEEPALEAQHDSYVDETYAEETYIAPQPATAENHPEPEPPAPQPPVSQSPVSQPPAAPPAVIGRYESDGTTYTMFADGSIEAQSETGIYQFASMADLKAFIEARQAPAEA